MHKNIELYYEDENDLIELVYEIKRHCSFSGKLIIVTNFDFENAKFKK